MIKQLPEILNIKTVAKSRIFEVQAVDLRFSNGEERTYERLTPNRRSSVMVIPIQNNELIFVKEYAVGSERYELGFPKGIVDAGEEPIESANRELQEEIGFGAKKLDFLRSLYSSPSHMYGLMHLFLAQDLYHQNWKAMSLNRWKLCVIRWIKLINYWQILILPKHGICPLYLCYENT